MRLAALNPSYAPPLEAEYATVSPSTSCVIDPP